MEKFIVLQAAVLMLFAVYITGQHYGGQEHVVVDNKCKCVKVTSRFVPSKEDPRLEILERNVYITIPLKNRENISDPSSPIRTDFVYDFSRLCRKCDPEEIQIGGETVTVSQAGCTNRDDEDFCYTYDRNKCYKTMVPFTFNGKTIMREVPITPESCYE